jgi:hypothetical protein
MVLSAYHAYFGVCAQVPGTLIGSRTGSLQGGDTRDLPDR